MPEIFEPYRTEPYSDFSKEENARAYQEALKSVRGQLGRDYPLIIGDERLETGRWLDSYNPSKTSERIGRTAMAGKEEVDTAMTAAWRAY
nr:L-glutamate gamma-semialdehyde dehydrogenase [Deinococcota bacterium]